MNTRSVVARFEAERQALALMEHPNIARVFDGGATETGRPYFVMELVRGLPITKYCEETKISTRQRLDLFGQVCRAVQHAHQKGIIHRAERNRARESEAEGRAVLRFFQDKVLSAARPEGQLGRNATIRAAVEAAERDITAAFTNQPLVEAPPKGT